MTDEQIKQNAEGYYDKLDSITIEVENEPNSIVDAYIAGAHSRDEEIKELKERLKYADESIADADKWIAKYKLEIYKLSNPWISIKDRLPEEGDEIILKRDYVRSYFRKVRAEDIRFIEYSEPNAKWMLIPKIQKGE